MFLKQIWALMLRRWDTWYIASLSTENAEIAFSGSCNERATIVRTTMFNSAPTTTSINMSKVRPGKPLTSLCPPEPHSPAPLRPCPELGMNILHSSGQIVCTFQTRYIWSETAKGAATLPCPGTVFPSASRATAGGWGDLGQKTGIRGKTSSRYVNTFCTQMMTKTYLNISCCTIPLLSGRSSLAKRRTNRTRGR